MSLSSAQQILKMFEQSLSKGRNLTHRFKNLGLMKLTLRRLNLSPLQILAVGYFLIVLVISLLLMMPVSNAQGQSQSFIDALFMASSGISTTGLTVVNIGEYYSLFGQVTLLIDFQIGGIGYMALFIFLGYLLQIDFSLKSRLVAAESLSGARIGRSYSFFSKVIFFTLVFELAGGLILGTYWMRDFSWTHALYLGIFHSISAFCTAGFCLFPESLVPYSHSFVVNAVIIILSLAGGIGFFVLNEIIFVARMKMSWQRNRKLSTHTQLAILVTTILITISSTIIFFSEQWSPSLSFIKKAMYSSFQAVSASTTDGFNTLNISTMAMPSLFIIILLMLIGASPGSTGGGIKTTTFGTIFLYIKAQLTGQRDVNFFKQRIPEETIRKSFSIFFLFAGIMILDLLLMATTENASFLAILFESASALGNTGLSMGITSNLTWIGKLALSMTMFIGRVGPLTIGMALVGRSKEARFSYVDGEVYVG